MALATAIHVREALNSAMFELTTAPALLATAEPTSQARVAICEYASLVSARVTRLRPAIGLMLPYSQNADLNGALAALARIMDEFGANAGEYRRNLGCD